MKPKCSRDDLEVWKCLPRGVYKINWDVGLEEKHNRTGVGVIVRDFSGKVIAARSLTIQTKQEPVIGEAMGAIYAAEFGRDIGVQNVTLEGDSLLVVKALKAATENLSSYGHLIDDTRWLLQRFQTVGVKHVKRNANKAAHGLAREAVKNYGDNIWMEETSPCVVTVHNNDEQYMRSKRERSRERDTQI